MTNRWMSSGPLPIPILESLSNILQKTVILNLQKTVMLNLFQHLNISDLDPDPPAGGQDDQMNSSWNH